MRKTELWKHKHNQAKECTCRETIRKRRKKVHGNTKTNKETHTEKNK